MYSYHDIVVLERAGREARTALQAFRIALSRLHGEDLPPAAIREVFAVDAEIMALARVLGQFVVTAPVEDQPS